MQTFYNKISPIKIINLLLISFKVLCQNKSQSEIIFTPHFWHIWHVFIELGLSNQNCINFIFYFIQLADWWGDFCDQIGNFSQLSRRKIVSTPLPPKNKTKQKTFGFFSFVLEVDTLISKELISPGMSITRGQSLTCGIGERFYPNIACFFARQWPFEKLKGGGGGGGWMAALSNPQPCMYTYTGRPSKHGMGYFLQYVDAITGISVWGNSSWEKRYQYQQFWFNNMFSRAHFVRQCRGPKFSLFSLN